jgi:predicted NAD/FAD-dependent oxidoreductase
VGLYFLPAFKFELERFMGNHAEITIDDGVIHLVANQSAKGRNEDSCVVVCHTVRQYQANSNNPDFRSEVLAAVLNSLATKMQVPVAKLQQLLQGSKVIDWRQCQCQETIPGYQGCALISSKPRLIVTGDYFSADLSAGAVSGMVHAAYAVSQAVFNETSIPPSLGPFGGAAAHTGPRVLIVGGGPTGCLLAAQLRRRSPDIRISVWECARGVGGRMSSKRFEINGNQVVLDMSAQVLSCTMQPEIKSEIDYLQSQRLVMMAHGIVATEERGAQGGMDQNMAHFWPMNGASSIFRHYLNEADVDEFRCNTRVSQIEKVTGVESSKMGWTVTAMKGDVSDPHQPYHVRSQFQENFDAVVLAMPHHDVMRIDGVSEVCGHDVHNSLQQAQSDKRWSIGIVLASWLKPTVQSFFDGSAERIVDNNMIHLIAYQNAKREQHYPAIVMHSTRSFSENRSHTKESVWNAVKQLLCQMLGVDQPTIEQGVLGCKLINWWECQTIKSGGPTVVGCASPPLVFAGDWVTNANFSGAVEAAGMAADAVAGAVGIRGTQRGWLQASAGAVPVPHHGGRRGSNASLSSGIGGGALSWGGENPQKVHSYQPVGNSAAFSLQQAWNPSFQQTSSAFANQHGSNLQIQQAGGFHSGGFGSQQQQVHSGFPQQQQGQSAQQLQQMQQFQPPLHSGPQLPSPRLPSLQFQQPQQPQPTAHTPQSPALSAGALTGSSFAQEQAQPQYASFQPMNQPYSPRDMPQDMLGNQQQMAAPVWSPRSVINMGSPPQTSSDLFGGQSQYAMNQQAPVLPMQPQQYGTDFSINHQQVPVASQFAKGIPNGNQFATQVPSTNPLNPMQQQIMAR